MKKESNFQLFKSLKGLGILFKSYEKFTELVRNQFDEYVKIGIKQEPTFSEFISYAENSINSKIIYFSSGKLTAELLDTDFKYTRSELYLMESSLKYYRKQTTVFLEQADHDLFRIDADYHFDLSDDKQKFIKEEGLNEDEALVKSLTQNQNEFNKFLFLKNAVIPLLKKLLENLEREISNIEQAYGHILEEMIPQITHGSIGSNRIKQLIELPDNEVEITLNQAYEGLSNIMREDKLEKPVWTTSQLVILFHYLRETKIISPNIKNRELSALISKMTTFNIEAITHDFSGMQEIMSKYKKNQDGYHPEFVAEELENLSKRIRANIPEYIRRELGAKNL